MLPDRLLMIMNGDNANDLLDRTENVPKMLIHSGDIMRIPVPLSPLARALIDDDGPLATLVRQVNTDKPEETAKMKEGKGQGEHGTHRWEMHTGIPSISFHDLPHVHH